MSGGIAHLLPGFWAVGASTVDLGGARLSWRPGLENEPTATFLHRVRAGPDLAAVLDRGAEVVGAPVARVFLDDGTPARVEATLVAQDWAVESMLQLVLPEDVAVTDPGTGATVRPAGAADWGELADLFRADHVEEDREASRPVRPQASTDRVVAARRLLPPPVHYLVAVADGIAGFVATWPGEGGTGLVEDLFVRADDRGRRLATTLIAHAVDRARAGGARSVAIGADPCDTPKHLYARLGFVPTGVLRTATRPHS